MKKLVALVMGLMMMLMMVAGCGSDGPKKMDIGLNHRVRDGNARKKW